MVQSFWFQKDIIIKQKVIVLALLKWQLLIINKNRTFDVQDKQLQRESAFYESNVTKYDWFKINWIGALFPWQRSLSDCWPSMQIK